MSFFGLAHRVVNIPAVKRFLTNNRLAVRLYFGWKYLRHDPYGLLDSDYEREKLERTIAAAAAFGPYESILEIGCGEGLLAARLMPMAKSLLAVDLSGAAVARARERLAGVANARVERMDILVDDLGGPFGLVAASEALYYLGLEQLAPAAEKIKNLVKPGGGLLLTHARALGDDVSGAPLKSFGAKTIHDLFAASPDFEVASDTMEPGYRITFLRKKAAR